MQSKPRRYGESWERDELVLAFDLYCRIPFAKTKANNKDVQALAKLLGRSPAGVARKLGNFGSFDPELKKRDISGLGNTSKHDEAIWNEFHARWPQLVLLADRLRQERAVQLGVTLDEVDAWLQRPSGPSERTRSRKERVHQSFFRSSVLSAYQGRCCVTGITLVECLRAGHIVPWSISQELRADPRNGLCLSATFERLFDTGLLAITPGLRITVSSFVLSHKDRYTREFVGAFHGRQMIVPHRFPPLRASLDWHFQNIFKG